MQTGKDRQEKWSKPSVRTPDFRVLTSDEAAQVRGGGWGAGTCPGVGFSCFCSGGFGWGICLGVGYSAPAKAEKQPSKKWWG